MRLWTKLDVQKAIDLKKHCKYIHEFKMYAYLSFLCSMVQYFKIHMKTITSLEPLPTQTWVSNRFETKWFQHSCF